MTGRDKDELLGRRGALLAELFLQELGAEFVARQPPSSATTSSSDSTILTAV
jgi:hypothetical protein